MVVEGADAVTTGGVVDLTDADVADVLDANVTLIATYEESRDLQTAALDAPGVKALVLTDGHEPSRAILGRAAERGVPVLLVDADTLTAVERAEAVVRSGRVRDEETVEIMRGLLTEHADVDALLD